VLEAAVCCFWHDDDGFTTLLGKDAPFEALVVRELLYWPRSDDEESINDEAFNLFSWYVSHVPSRTGVHVLATDSFVIAGRYGTQLEECVDLALASDLERVTFACEGIQSAHYGAALARLVSGGTLSALRVVHYDILSSLLVHKSGAPLPLLTALRESATLTELTLNSS
jgi:hypothetical protein